MEWSLFPLTPKDGDLCLVGFLDNPLLIVATYRDDYFYPQEGASWHKSIPDCWCKIAPSCYNVEHE